MKYIAIFATALVLATGAAFALWPATFRPIEKPKAPPTPSPTATAKPPTPPPTPSPTPAMTPAEILDLAKEAAKGFAEIQATSDARPPGSTPAPSEEAKKTRDLQMKTMQGAGRLQAELRRTPAAWNSVLDFLVTVEDVRVTLKIVERIRNSSDAAVETRALGMAQAGQPANARRIALGLLGGRKSKESLDAIAGIAEAEADAVIRLAAVNALGDLMRHGAGPELGERAREVLKKVAESDADAAIRDAAAKFSANRPPSMPPRGPGRGPFPTTPHAPQPTTSKTP